MQNPRSIVALTTALVVAVLGFAEPSSAGKSGRRGEVYRYATSVACGTDSEGIRGIVGGVYATSVHLLVPGSTSATIRATLSLAQHIGDTEPGPVSSPLEITLGAGRALELACDEIANDFLFATPHGSSELVSGFLELESSVPLEAEVTFTAATTAGSEISLDVVPLAERRVAPRPLPSPSPATETICHVPPGNPSAAHTLTVGASAVPAHLAHGDTRGACPP